MIKRFWIVVASVVVVVALGAGSTFAWFTAVSGNEQNSFASGTVSLDSTAMIPFRVEGIAPGDSGTKTVSITYTGSLDAYVGLDSSVTGTLSACDATYPIQVNITSDSTMVSPTGTGTNQLIGRYTTGAVIPLQVHWGLDLLSPNPCQEGVATVNLLVHAVQAQNNEGTNGPVSWGGSSNPDYTTCNALGEYSSAGACLVTSSPVSGHITPWQGWAWRGDNLNIYANDPNSQRLYKVHFTPGTYSVNLHGAGRVELDLGGPYSFDTSSGYPEITWGRDSDVNLTFTAPTEGTYYLWVFGWSDTDYTMSWSRQSGMASIMGVPATRSGKPTSQLDFKR